LEADGVTDDKMKRCSVDFYGFLKGGACQKL